VTSLGLVILGKRRHRQPPGAVPAAVAAALAGVLPPGAAVRALRGATCFADDGVTRAYWVLGLWAVVPLLLIALLDAISRRRPA
jgi:hypothetical protein